MYSNNIIEDIITKVLTEWKDKHSQLGLESIEVKSVEWRNRQYRKENTN